MRYWFHYRLLLSDKRKLWRNDVEERSRRTLWKLCSPRDRFTFVVDINWDNHWEWNLIINTKSILHYGLEINFGWEVNFFKSDQLSETCTAKPCIYSSSTLVTSLEEQFIWYGDSLLHQIRIPESQQSAMLYHWYNKSTAQRNLLLMWFTSFFSSPVVIRVMYIFHHPLHLYMQISAGAPRPFLLKQLGFPPVFEYGTRTGMQLITRFRRIPVDVRWLTSLDTDQGQIVFIISRNGLFDGGWRRNWNVKCGLVLVWLQNRDSWNSF